MPQNKQDPLPSLNMLTLLLKFSHLSNFSTQLFKYTFSFFVHSYLFPLLFDSSMSFKATEFTAHFDPKDIDLYIAKHNRLNITDPYKALGVLLMYISIKERIGFLTCSILIQVPHQLSLILPWRLKAYKSLEGHKWTQSNLLMNKPAMSSLKGYVNCVVS